MPFHRFNGFYSGHFQPQGELMSQDERNQEVNDSLNVRLGQLNLLIDKKEAELKSMMVARDTVLCFHDYQDENDDRGEHQHLLGMIKQKGGWRLCYCFHYESFGHPDREVRWKPLVDCSIEERIQATKHIEKLKGRIIDEKEKLMPELENAIENLAQ